MSNLNHTSLSLRTQLSGVVASLASCDPADYFATSRLVQQITVLRGQLEREQRSGLLPLCSLALRTAEALNKDGKLGPQQTLDAIDGMLEQLCGSLGIEPSTEAAAVPAPAPEAPVPAKVVLGRTSSTPALKLVSSRKLGDLMVQLAMLNPSQVEQALNHQRMTGCRFGEALIQLRLLTKEAVESAVRMQNARRPSRDDWNGGR